jgi:hypothetical protein
MQKAAGEMRSLSQRVNANVRDLLARLTLNADTLATAKAMLGMP